MSSLTMENKTLILKLQMNNSPSVVMCNDDRGNDDDSMLSKHDLDSGTKESREEAHELSAVSAKVCSITSLTSCSVSHAFLFD